MSTQIQIPHVDQSRVLKLSGEEILEHLSHLDCLEEVLELVDLDKRREATLYSIEYQIAVRRYVELYDFSRRPSKEFDQFLMQLVLTASVIRNGSLVFHQKLNRICLNLINAIYDQQEISLQLQCVMFHLQMVAGDNSFALFKLNEEEFYLSKSRQHFVMAVDFVQNISVAKAYEAQTRVSDISTEMLFLDINQETLEQAIVDVHNAIEFGKFIKHSYVSELKIRYADLCDILSDVRYDDREYWLNYSFELREEALENITR